MWGPKPYVPRLGEASKLGGRKDDHSTCKCSGTVGVHTQQDIGPKGILLL